MDMYDKNNLSSANKKTVVIVVPLYRNYLTDDEQISLRHLIKYLGRYDKIFISPEGIQTPSLKGFAKIEFKKDFFKNTFTYNALLMRKNFYKSFLDYEYILIYQLDCLVFKDELLEWSKKGYDYIGSPWFKDVMGDRLYWADTDCVGNGGFSLRRVRSFIRLLDNYNSFRGRVVNFLDKVRSMKKRSLGTFLFKAVQREKRKFQAYVNKTIEGEQGEDIFIATKAKKYFPEFKISSVEEALKFGFDEGPEYCFEKNGQKLPFGCHGWHRDEPPRYIRNRKFWEPYLLKGDNEISSEF